MSIHIHAPDRCEGTHCPFHNPSEHHMRDWKAIIRDDRPSMVTERRCPHGVGHPDPDSLDWIERVTDRETRDAEAVHGCDGCCQDPALATSGEPVQMFWDFG